MPRPRHPVFLGLLVIACVAMAVSALVDAELRYVYMFLLLLGLLGIWRELYPGEDGDEL